jgi:Tol biopolymer transport system component/DNA-binding winged helix-turn-helix (wHTH) protein
MPLSEVRDDVVRFGAFEFSARTGELRKNGLRLKLQEQPARILRLLLENRGELVSREQIQKQLWPDGVFVDYENAINSAVRKLREALLDTSESPRFIETLPRRGYRFVAAIAQPASPVTQPSATSVAETADSSWAGSASRIARWGAGLAAVVTILVIAFVFWPARRETSSGFPIVVPLTANPGFELHPSFSPDGNRVAFTWNGGAPGNFDIYVQSIGSGKPRRLTADLFSHHHPVWSPDGRWIAFAHMAQRCELLAIPVLGGAERRITQLKTGTCTLDGWTPDGRWLVASTPDGTGKQSRICLVSFETGELRPLTFDSVGTEYNDWHGVISPDGRLLAFSRAVFSGDLSASDIYVLSLAAGYSPDGEPRRLTSEAVDNTNGIAWSGGSRDLVFSTWKGGTAALWKTAADGSTKPVPLPFGDAGYPAISAQGQLVYEKFVRSDTDIWRVNLAGSPHPAALIASTRIERSPQYSPDGKKIAFQSFSSGTGEIWTSDSDGSNRSQLTTMGMAGSPSWSPDSQTIAFDALVDKVWQVFTVSARGGKPLQITTDPKLASFRPSWSHDGKWIWFGRHPGIWKVPFGGGAAVRISYEGGGPVESEDGKRIYYWGSGSMWRMNADGSGAEQLTYGGSTYGDGNTAAYAVTRDGIWFAGRGPEAGVRFLSFATGSQRLVFKPPTPDGSVALGMSASPDGHWLIYTQDGPTPRSELMLVRDFR